jgi:hypothetical protein
MTTRSIQTSMLALLASFAAVGCGAADGAAETETALSQSNPNPALFPHDARLAGVDMVGLAEDWWSWAMSTPLAVNPNVDPTQDCNVNQDGAVFFLAHPLLGPSTAGFTCTVPADKPIVVSLATVFNDFPCPDPTFVPAPGQSLFDFLIGPAREGQNHVAALDVTLDGQPLKDMLSYRVASDDVFEFTGDPSMAAIDSCVTGTPQQGVVDTFLIVLKPLESGTHTLTTRTTSIFGTVFGPRTITLQVAAD